MTGRRHWVCVCGRAWPLSTSYCHADECEMHRRYIEDEDAIPLPAQAPGADATRKDTGK